MSPIITTMSAPAGRSRRVKAPVGGGSASILLSSATSVITVSQDGATDWTVTLTRTNHTGSVSLSVTGLPTGVTASFPDGSTYTGATANLRVRLSAAVDATLVTQDSFTVTGASSGVSDATLDAAVTVTTAVNGFLPAGNFTTAKMSMTAVYPRPDTETYVSARHRVAYPGLANRIPIVIQGGAYPYVYSIVAGPVGATIGATYADADYGVWSWTPPTNEAAQTVTVRVTDQQLNTVDVTWEITATDTAFVFLDPNAVSSGSGTLASPFKTWSDAFGTDSTTATNAGKVLVLRGGSHTMTGYAGNSGNLAIVGSNTKPIGWVAYPGETPVVDCATALVNMITAGDGNDLFVQGIQFENARTDVANSRFFFFSGNAGSRTTWHDVDFVNLGRGTSGGTDNPGAIVMFNSATLRQYVAVVGCTINDFEAPLFGSIYAVKYLVVDDCLLGAGKTSGGIQGIYLKERCTYGTIRRVRSFTSGDDTGIIQSNLAGGSVIGEPRYIEVCYCTVRTPSFSTTNEKFAIVPNYSNNTTDTGSQCWTYRNTIVGGVRVLSPASPGWTGTYERNVHITNDSPIIANDTNNLVTLSENLVESSANLSTVLDTNYLLTGASRTTYLGTHGAEISAGV